MWSRFSSFLLLFVLLSASPALAETFTVSGQIKYSSELPVAGVLVVDELENLPNRTTDSQGRFSYTGLADGTSYQLSFSKRHHNFSPSTVPGTISGANKSHNITATVVTYRISGTIIDEDLDEPISGVSVNAGSLGSTTTNASGSFTISGVPGDTSYSILFSKDRYKFEPIRATGFLGDEDVTLDIIGYEVFVLSGHVRLTNLYKSGLDGVSISLENISGEGYAPLSGTTDLEGYWEIDCVRRATWEISSEKEYHKLTFLSPPAEIEVIDQDIEGLDFQAAPVLGNPIHIGWSSFFSGLNYLEIVNVGEEPLTADVDFFTEDGELTDTLRVEIDPHGQKDLDVSQFDGYQDRSTGTIRIAFSHDEFDGRMSYYKPRLFEETHDFGYSIPFANPISGKGYLNYNRMQPSQDPADADNEVLQLVSIVNVSPTPQTFTLKRYTRAGTPLPSETFSGTLAPMQRFDFDGADISGVSPIGLNEVIPSNSNAKYFLEMVRLGANSPGESFIEGTAFAFAMQGRNGVGRIQHAPVSRGGGAANFLEVTNVLTASTPVRIEFLDNNGSSLGAPIEDVLAPREQRHYDASIYLDPGESGVARVIPGKHKSVIGQSMFYFYEPIKRGVNSIYGSSIRDSFNDRITGSYNLFLNMYNWLKVFNLDNQPTNVSITVSLPSGENRVRNLTIPPGQGVDLGIHEGNIYGTQSLEYGLITIRTEVPGSVFSELLRVRQTSLVPPIFDFTAPTPMR